MNRFDDAFRHLVSLSFSLAYLLFNCTPMHETALRYTHVALELLIDYLNEVQLELSLDLNSHGGKVGEIDQEYDLSTHYRKRCPRQKYTARIVHRDPLIIYIENFLSKNELEHLLEIT